MADEEIVDVKEEEEVESSEAIEPTLEQDWSGIKKFTEDDFALIGQFLGTAIQKMQAEVAHVASSDWDKIKSLLSKYI